MSIIVQLSSEMVNIAGLYTDIHNGLSLHVQKD